MKNINLNIIHSINFPEPFKCWLKSFTEQMKVKQKTDNVDYFGKIRNINGGLPEVFKIYSN